MAYVNAQPSRLTLEDGRTMAYRQWGPSEGAPVVLLHSLAMTGEFWSPVAELLSQAGFRSIAPDCPGHGHSSVDAELSVASAADDIVELLDHLGVPAACVAGASMGGSLALAFAIRHPARTLALGLVDTTAWYGENARPNWEERAQKALTEGLSSLVCFQTTRWFSDSFRADNPHMVERVVSTFLANDLEGYAAACRMLGACDMRSGLPRIAVPTTILVGEEDYATPIVMAEAMADAIPNAKLHVLPGLRHLTPLEEPGLVAGHLRNTFMEGIVR